MASRVPPETALAEACRYSGLDGEAAEVLYHRSNTVYKLAGQPVVVRLRYAPGSADWMNRLTVSVRVTAWLAGSGFPAVRPLDVPQPVTAHGYIVTFWHYLPDAQQPREDSESLGRLLRQLHELPDPPVHLPPARPLSSLRADAERCSWLTEAERSWVLGRAEDLQHRYARTAWSLGTGMIHCDAWAENLIHTPGQVVLADWDSVSFGPREQDIVPASIRHRFGRPAAEWYQFCSAYGINPDDLPGLVVLKEMRELRTLVPYIRDAGHQQAQAEVRRRIADLKTGKQQAPWRALNLAP